jgi:hypothetical protein
MPRVIAYIDGFNVYYYLKSQKWERYSGSMFKPLLELLGRSDPCYRNTDGADQPPDSKTAEHLS